MEQRVKAIFEKDGWPGVWEALAKREVQPEDAAKIAEDMARKLDERPPIDPFWISGAEAVKKFHIPNGVRARTLLAWLSQSAKGSWDEERITFEMKSLIDSQFINWNMSANWGNGIKTLAEAVLFEGHKSGLFNWRWNWSAVRPEWLVEMLEYHPSKLMMAITDLENRRLSGWTNDEEKLAFACLKMWRFKPSALDSLISSMPLVREKWKGFLKDLVNAWDAEMIKSENLVHSKPVKHTLAL